MKQTAKIGLILAAGGCILLGSYGVYHLSQPKAQAKIVLNRFLKACEKGDREQILRYSIAEQMAPLYASMSMLDETGEPDTAENEIDEFVETASGLQDYEILGCRNAMEDHESSIVCIRRNNEIEKKILARAGVEPDPADVENGDRYLSFLESIEDAYAFPVRVKTDGEWEEEETELGVVKVGGVWKADVFTMNVLIPAMHDPDETEPSEPAETTQNDT